MSGWDDPTPLSGMVNRDPPSNQKNPVRTGWRGWGKSMFAGWQAKAAERGPAATARVALMGNVTVFYGVTGEGDTEADLEARQMSECFLAKHPDAKWWVPGRPGAPHVAWWARFDPQAVFYVGGFGNEHYIGAELTTLYFVLSVVHCVLQVILQLAAHAINVNARHLVTHILEQAKLTMDKFALVENKRRVPQVRTTDLTLTLCRGIPGQFGFTGKDVCDVLWSQSRGLVNDTVEDFLSPSSESDDNNNKSSSDSDDDKTTSPLPVQAPTVSFSSTRASSTFASSTSNSVSTFPVAPTLVSSTPTLSSTSRRTTTSLSVSITTTSFVASTSSPHDSPTSSTFTSFPSETSTTTGPTAPTGIQNLIRPRPGSGSSDSGSDNDTGVISAHFVRRRALKQRSTVSESRDSTRKVFDREKLRPLSLPRSQPRVPSQSSSVDIDESHPDLKTHIRRARVAPITNSLLKRTLEGSTLEYIPIAPRAVDPMRFVSRHSRRTKRSRNLTARSPFISDEQDVKITPIWRFEVDSDDEKKHQSGNLAGNSTVPMNMNRGKPILVSVKISGLVGPGMGDQQIMAGNGTATFGDVELSPGCALALSWPAQVLRDFAREDLAMIGFQVWLLGMSVVAILNESVPHMVAGLFTQALSTGWSAFQMARSASFRAQYGETIVRGACSGVDVLPEYFTHRTTDEIPIVVFNAVFLITMTILSWRVCKYPSAMRSLFFVTSSALWVDELLNGSIACFAEHQGLYKGVFITSILLLLPWLILGWIGVRRENKLMMHAFLIISLLFITAWAAMFASDVYRWSFATWPFFAAMTVTSFVVLVATTGLAIVCRYNFKKGLALFLQSQQILPSGDFTDAMPDPEKVGFPAQRAGEELPTFSVAFGHGGVPQPPSQMFPVQPAAAVSRSTTLSNDRPAGYSVNPYVTNRSDFWGEGNVARSASMRSKSSTDTSSAPTIRSTDPMLFDHDIPRYSSEEEPDSVRRELPQWEEVRRSQLPSTFDLQPSHLSIQPQTQARPQLDRDSTYSSGTTGTGTGQFEVLRDGEWQKVDARELYRASIVSGVTHTSGFSGASWARGDDAGPLPTRAAVPVPPVPAYRPLQAPLPVAAAPRAFVGLPGKNIKPQTTASGRVTQQFSPPQATGVLGGVAVPPGW
ncbi:pyridoxamine 5'-phosphate oxidase family protein [Rhizoctonia solani]|uniref:Pyridoxamine 5'-phosphate oxidase family protein n=1 Tax=Rhizoctonia solani TaxID=456999 RepID=A0A8H8P4C5_9AGAM|nr:pyridoxamine 5'-phosphate oxidase family protein [Rhizoctonia solani]QRW24240.1 pyridoxamine 5'-phosphate oxidase family protein [Rhizoctonia solani]